MAFQALILPVLAFFTTFLYLDMMPEKNGLGFLLAALGSAFVINDIGFDVGLAYEYFQDYLYYNKVNEICPGSPACNSTGECATAIRNLGLDPPKQNVGAFSLLFVAITVLWLVLGCLSQTTIATVLELKRSRTFRSMPKFVRVLTLVACLVMMGPVVILCYVAVRCVEGVTVVGAPAV